MPNWCAHDLVVSGRDPLALRAFDSAVLPEHLDLDDCSILAALLPLPDALVHTTAPTRPPYSEREIDAAGTESQRAAMQEANLAFARQAADLVESYGADNWYDWSLANWGTKWPDQVHRVERRARSLRISGYCAWSPPLEGIKSISAMFPTLRFSIHYYEAGNGFAGRFVVTNGSVLVSEQRPYRGRRGG